MTTSTLLPGSEVTISLDWRAAARLIDHTLLKPDASNDDVARACNEARGFGFASVMVHPWQLARAADLLHGSEVRVGSPVGYSTGAAMLAVKRFEAEELLKAGAQELDLVMNVGALRSGERALVLDEMTTIATLGHEAGAVVKVILETPILSLEEKLLSCHLAVEAGMDFVKTATGLTGPARPDDVALMRGVVGDRLGVKASGGIRTAERLRAMVSAGANRIGTSASVAIMREMGAEGIG